jgi:chemotaxis signal transduction protein
MLSIQVGAEARPYVLGLDGLCLLRRSPRIAPLPGTRRALRGLSTLRGRSVPVFSLARLLGLPEEAEAGWTVGVGAELDFALCFERMQAIVQVLPAQLQRAPNGKQGHIATLFLGAEGSLPVLDIESIRRAVQSDAHGA